MNQEFTQPPQGNQSNMNPNPEPRKEQGPYQPGWQPSPNQGPQPGPQQQPGPQPGQAGPQAPPNWQNQGNWQQPNQQQGPANQQQTQQNGQNQQTGQNQTAYTPPSLAEEIKQCWKQYQNTKKVCEELGDNPDLKKIVEETAYQQFKESVRDTVANHIKSTWGPNFPQNQGKSRSSYDWFPKKKLYRSTKNSMLAGVCGGIAEFFDIDVTLFRVILIIFLLVCLPTMPPVSIAGVLIYFILAILLPLQPTPTEKM